MISRETVGFCEVISGRTDLMSRTAYYCKVGKTDMLTINRIILEINQYSVFWLFCFVFIWCRYQLFLYFLIFFNEFRCTYNTNNIQYSVKMCNNTVMYVNLYLHKLYRYDNKKKQYNTIQVSLEQTITVSIKKECRNFQILQNLSNLY